MRSDLIIITNNVVPYCSSGFGKGSVSTLFSGFWRITPLGSIPTISSAAHALPDWIAPQVLAEFSAGMNDNPDSKRTSLAGACLVTQKPSTALQKSIGCWVSRIVPSQPVYGHTPQLSICLIAKVLVSSSSDLHQLRSSTHYRCNSTRCLCPVTEYSC